VAAGLLIVLTLVPAIIILTRRLVSSRDLAAGRSSIQRSSHPCCGAMINDRDPGWSMLE
jgi:hypothetical protein